MFRKRINLKYNITPRNTITKNNYLSPILNNKLYSSPTKSNMDSRVNNYMNGNKNNLFENSRENPQENPQENPSENLLNDSTNNSLNIEKLPQPQLQSQSKQTFSDILKDALGIILIPVSMITALAISAKILHW